MSARPIEERWSNGLARTPCRCAANAQLVGVARSGSTASSSSPRRTIWLVMRRIDELHLELPFYGSRRMTSELNKEGPGVNLQAGPQPGGCGVMGIEGVLGSAPRHEQSRARAARYTHYLLRGLEDCRAEPRVGGAT